MQRPPAPSPAGSRVVGSDIRGDREVTALEAALRYAAMGWAVLPCNQQKTPLTIHGFKDASLDPEVIRAWWPNGSGPNVAIAVPEGHIVVDIDSEQAFQELKARGLHLPATARQKSPRGSHSVYRMAPGVEVQQSAGRIAPGVDIRAPRKGYILAEPSVVGGKPYKWEVPLLSKNIADAPDWLVET